jgi:hypothetical protein
MNLDSKHGLDRRIAGIFINNKKYRHVSIDHFAIGNSQQQSAFPRK